MVGFLRGCFGGIIALVFSTLFGIAIGRQFGWFPGILAGFMMIAGLGVVVGKLINSKKKITTADCIIPLVMSLISAIVFMPIGLVSGNLFSAATCITAGAFLCVSMWLNKNGRLAEWALIMPMLTFIYEMLPIDLPTDLDNVLGLAGSFASMKMGYMKSLATQSAKSFAGALFSADNQQQGIPSGANDPECTIEDATPSESPPSSFEQSEDNMIIANAKNHLKQRVTDRASQTINRLTDKMVDGFADEIDAFIDEDIK